MRGCFKPHGIGHLCDRACPGSEDDSLALVPIHSDTGVISQFVLLVQFGPSVALWSATSASESSSATWACTARPLMVTSSITHTSVIS